MLLSTVMMGSATTAHAKSNNDGVIKTNKITRIETLSNSVNSKINNNEAKVAVITKKVDSSGFSLSGAVLQILDLNGNVLDEWTSDGKEHISFLPEGEYILHEKSAPNGYKISADQKFLVKIEEKNINAGVDHDTSNDVCWHYGGVPLYYIESNGEKKEAYCVNQELDEPNNISYDGQVLDMDNIRLFMPDADTSISNEELYNRVLDIVYLRNCAEDQFPNLSEIEIRYITEYALKNYTSAMVRDGDLFRRYKYDPSSKTKFVDDKGNGSALGQLAKHWWYYHNKQTLPDEYAQLFYYLTNNYNVHPENMNLYVYSTNSKTENNESYQNLIGVDWIDPYDNSIELVKVNENVEIPKTGDDNDLEIYTLLFLGSSIGLIATTKKLNKSKKLVKKL